MLIKVFDSDWFDPTGIRLEECAVDKGTIIVTGEHYVRDTTPSSTPKPDYRREITGLFIDDKAPDEVAAEINKQLKED